MQFEEYSAGGCGCWVDDPGSNSALDPRTYILSAAVCFAEDIGASRTAAGELMLRGQRKLHWIDVCRGAIVEDRCGSPEYFSWIEGKTMVYL